MLSGYFREDRSQAARVEAAALVQGATVGADQSRSRASAASESFLFPGALLPALPEALPLPANIDLC